MKITYVAVLLAAISVVVMLPEANALTQRTDFSDNHFTYHTFTSIHICGDRVCTNDEWNQWIGQLMSNQIQNGASVPSSASFTSMYSPPTPSSNTGMVDTSSAKITKVTTFDIGNGEFSSFVSISYDGYSPVNHIVISQTKPGISIHRAWIEPQWSSVITTGNVTFDSTQSVLHHNSVINLVLVTSGQPLFSLDALSSNLFPYFYER